MHMRRSMVSHRTLLKLLLLLCCLTAFLGHHNGLNVVVESLSFSPIVNRRTWGETSLVSLLVPSGSQPANSKDNVVAAATAERSSESVPFLLSEYYNEPTTKPSAGRSFFPTLTPPFFKRATYRYEVGRNAWAFEQLLTFANVTATIRTNVILLKEGGLWVHSPQWPTGEFCALLRELGHPIKHIVLPCNAIEHKAPIKAFAKVFPDASVWIAPGQYGPFGSCGFDTSDCSMGYKVDGIFPLDTTNVNKKQLPPWADEFDIVTLYADLPENAGPVSEVAFCHRPTQTLVATDAVVFVPPKAPSIFGTYFDSSTIDSPDFWPKTVLQAVFLPLRTKSDEHGEAYYPGYKAVENKLVRAPILRAFCDARAPDAVRNWVQQIGNLKFDRILTSHFASPISASPRNVVEAFSYLTATNDEIMSATNLPKIICRDWELLNGLNTVIEQNKLGAPVVFDFQKGCQVVDD